LSTICRLLAQAQSQQAGMMEPTWLTKARTAKEQSNETHISAKPPEARPQTRVSRPHVDPRRTTGHQGAPGQGQEAPVCLMR
jgi:hypothetical protein